MLGYENILADILIKKNVSILSYGLDSLIPDTKTVVTKAKNSAFRWLFNRLMRKFDSIRL